ncbi:MAG TPA: pirin family protein [bacterium]|nr:pirin family protein [bacterium]
MITFRPARARGHFNHGWLDTYHSFSFAEYLDPRYMGYRTLRVINEDKVAPRAGFPTHGHRDMEIVTYILEGALAHKDSTGSAGTIRPGDVQRMSAGTGVQHSEFNAVDEVTHLLQIWILPSERGIEPSYEEKHFPESERRGRLRVIAAPDGREGAVTIRQDALIYASLLGPGDQVTHRLEAGRGAWLQLAKGVLDLQGHQMNPGDGAAIEDLAEFTMRGGNPESGQPAEFLLFDLA